MLRFFSLPIYVKVFKNRFELTAYGSSTQTLNVQAITPFTTSRLLVGNFPIAETTLSHAIKQLQGDAFFKKAPAVLIQPMEMIEGGLCMVEEKLFYELALGGGARKVVLHVGSPMNQQQVIERLYG